jgi:formylglycine-generating enzyme
LAASAAGAAGTTLLPMDSPGAVGIAAPVRNASIRSATASPLPVPPPQAAEGAATASASAAPSLPPPCPPGMTHVGRFCIDQYEAHLVVGDPGGPMALWPHNRPAPKNRRYEARSEAGQFPQGYINQLEAARACDNAGKRLCRFDEWRHACLGRANGTGNTYAYGTEEVPKRCNILKPNLLDQLWGNDARKWTYENHMNHPLLGAIDGWLARSGEYEGCATPTGIHDQVGNLHEWVAERVDAGMSKRYQVESVQQRRMPQPYRLGDGILLGGFFSTGHQHGHGCYYTTIAHLPSYHDYSTGFRCCADAK